MVQLNDFALQWREVRDDALATFMDFGESGWYILGGQVQQFEDDLARTWGVAHAIGVGSGLDAIEISLRALGCKTGDKVLTTPVSAFATTLAILKLGAIPVYVDTDRFGLIDLDRAHEALKQDSSIRFFVPVHLYGHALDMHKLASLQDEFELRIVEDCAQSIGAAWKDIAVGTVGQTAATSFYPTKNLGAMGDGGAILTSDADLSSVARSLRDYGQTAKYHHDFVGYNSRLDTLQAALLRRVGLPRLKRWTKRRIEVACTLINGIHNPAVCVPGSPPNSKSCWHLFPITVASDRKSDFRGHLKSRQVSTGEHYPIAIPDQKAMNTTRFEIAVGGIESARSFVLSEVTLPIHPYLTEREVESVVEAVNGWTG